MKSIVVLGFLFLLSCQQKPTMGVTESGVLLENRDYRQVIKTNSVLFDTRSPFEFNISRVPGSINLPPADFVVERDPMDAARRLSLYGVTPETPVVILGEGKGEESRLAWEFEQLGVQKIETLKVQVFRTLNVQIEPPRKNATIWKPETRHGELSEKEFLKQLDSNKGPYSSRARTEALQSSAVSAALQDRVLVIQVEGQEKPIAKYTYVIERKWEKSIELFDSQGLLKANDDWSKFLKRFDYVYLLDKSNDRYSRAYALTQWGAKSLWLVGK